MGSGGEGGKVVRACKAEQAWGMCSQRACAAGAARGPCWESVCLWPTSGPPCQAAKTGAQPRASLAPCVARSAGTAQWRAPSLHLLAPVAGEGCRYCLFVGGRAHRAGKQAAFGANRTHRCTSRAALAANRLASARRAAGPSAYCLMAGSSLLQTQPPAAQVRTSNSSFDTLWVRASCSAACVGLAFRLLLAAALARPAFRWWPSREEAAEMTGVDTRAAASPGCGPACSQSTDCVRRRRCEMLRGCKWVGQGGGGQEAGRGVCWGGRG